MNLTLDLALSRYGVSTNLHHKSVSSSKSMKKCVNKKGHKKTLQMSVGWNTANMKRDEGTGWSNVTSNQNMCNLSGVLMIYQFSSVDIQYVSAFFFPSRLSSIIPAFEMLSGSQTFKLSIHHNRQSCTQSLALFHAEISFRELSAGYCFYRLEVTIRLALREKRLHTTNGQL